MHTPRSIPTTGSPLRDVAVVAVVLLVGSTIPVPFGRHPEFDWFGPDKLLHLVGHGSLAVVTADALGANPTTSERAGGLAVCLSTGYALLLGRLQVRVPGREPERADLAASALGSVLGVVGWRYLSESDRPAEP
jgi:hypothetical protein